MTLADELLRTRVPMRSTNSRLIELGEPPLRLPFNGQLSADEQVMADQGTFDYGPVPWE